jgi:hypothetical protein
LDHVAQPGAAHGDLRRSSTTRRMTAERCGVERQSYCESAWTRRARRALILRSVGDGDGSAFSDEIGRRPSGRDELSAIEPSRGVDPATVALWRASFAPWISGGGKIEALAGDKDVFNDGTVVMLNMPGHTPGHHSLLVRLKRMGNVLLSGDLAHLRENYESNGVPAWNFNRADTLASLDRFKQIAKNLKATVIIQHDARDIGKLPAFPESAN